MLFKASMLSLGLLATVAPAMAHDYQLGQVSIGHPWSRPTPPGTPVGVGYMTISNHGDTAVTLIAGDTPVAERVSIHETTMQDGLMTMRPLKKGLVVPAGQTVSLEPHSYHLMLEQLNKPLKEGDVVPLSLTFEGMAPLTVSLHVERHEAGAGMDQLEGHQNH